MSTFGFYSSCDSLKWLRTSCFTELTDWDEKKVKLVKIADGRDENANFCSIRFHEYLLWILLFSIWSGHFLHSGEDIWDKKENKCGHKTVWFLWKSPWVYASAFIHPSCLLCFLTLSSMDACLTLHDLWWKTTFCYDCTNKSMSRFPRERINLIMLGTYYACTYYACSGAILVIQSHNGSLWKTE